MKIIFLVLLYIFTNLSFASEINNDHWCNRLGKGFSGFSHKSFQLKKVTGKEKVYFIKGNGSPGYDDVGEGCPGNSESCKQKQYLVAGDLVITSRGHSDWTCSAFVTKDGDTIMGWLPTLKLEETPLSSIQNKSWIGTWKKNSKTMPSNLKIMLKNKLLKIEGYYSEPPREFSIDSLARPGKNFTEFQYDTSGKDACMASLFLLGNYLIVNQFIKNKQFGNCTIVFDGIYSK
jgi:hypothetical protein